jgi:tubulin-specific chaperone C
MPKAKFAFKRKAPVAGASSPQASIVLPTLPSTGKMTAQALLIPQTSTSNLTLSSRSFEYITLESLSNSILQRDLSISDLDHCIVNLIPSTLPVKGDDPAPGIVTPMDISAIHVRNITDTVLLFPQIAGSVLLHDVSRCTLVLGCHQVRLSDACASPKVSEPFLTIVPNAHLEQGGRISLHTLQSSPRALFGRSFFWIPKLASAVFRCASKVVIPIISFRI